MPIKAKIETTPFIIAPTYQDSQIIIPIKKIIFMEKISYWYVSDDHEKKRQIVYSTNIHTYRSSTKVKY